MISASAILLAIVVILLIEQNGQNNVRPN
jgi:hypothetical protein